MARGRSFVTITIYDKSGNKVERNINESRKSQRNMKRLLTQGYSKRTAKRMLAGESL